MILKNQKMITDLHMSVGQKLSLLATGRIENGVSFFDLVTLKDLNMAEGCCAYPSLNGIANSWDTALIEKVAAELAFRAKKGTFNAVVTPDTGVKMHAYSSALTEDPYLSGKLASAYAKGIVKAGGTPILQDCSLDQPTADFMDREADTYMIRDYIAKPFEIALKENPSGAVMTSDRQLKGGYRDVNRNIVNAILHDGKAFRACSVCRSTDPVFAVKSLAENTLLTDGTVKSLEEAYEAYLQLKASVDNGTATVRELEDACKDGTALSEEAIDVALDKFIDFVLTCENNAESLHSNATYIAEVMADARMISRQASAASIVLLKNADHALPLAARTKVAVIGRLAAAETAARDCFLETISNNKENLPFAFTGFAEGYDLDEERSDALIDAAVTLTDESDAALLFLGFDTDRQSRVPETRCLRLPANQLALTAALGRTGKKIIAVISGDYALDTAFDEHCGGLILMPAGGDYSNEALLQVLSGERNPSGKLAYTMYENTDEFFEERKSRKDLGRNRIGPFFGYRYYDTAEVAVKYPFGHGIGYTSFSYSAIKANADGVRFRLRNTGSLAGCETVQLYIGMKDSAVIRPYKELKGFEKIYLEPGQSKQVIFKFDPNTTFAYTDPADGRRAVEQGEYVVFIGSSVSDIRLTKSVYVNGCEFIGRYNLGKKEALSDYIQTKSNIINGRYYFETEQLCKKKIPVTRFLYSALILLAGVYDIMIAIARNVEVRYNLILIFVNLLVLFPILGLIRDVKRQKIRRRRILEMQTEIRENETVLADEPSLESLFSEEFPESAAAGEKETVLAAESENRQIELDKNTTLKTVADEISVFMRERGLVAESASVRALLSAMAVSRLLILKNADTTIMKDFVFRLNTYFGADSYSKADDTPDKPTRNPTEESIAQAADNSSSICFAVPDGSDLASAADWPAIASYAANPEKPNNCVWKNGEGEITIPANLWFIWILPQDSAIDRIAANIVRNAVAVDMELRKTKQKKEKSVVRPIRYLPFKKLCADSEKAAAADESVWKKIDKLEAWVNARTPYRIGNKAWRRLERYVYAYLACGGSASEAVDSVIGAILLKDIVPLLNESGVDTDELYSALERISGKVVSV